VPSEAFGGTRCHLFVEYDSDMQVELGIPGHGLTLGMKSFKISGEAVLLLRPVMEEITGCVGGCTFYFSNRPKIEMDFTGLANVADFGGISDIVRGVMHQVLADKMVLPNAITQLIGYTNVAVYPLVMGPPHPPIGVLQVTTVKAEGIKSGDWNLWPSTAADDNYIKFTMGDQEWKAPTAEMGKSHHFFVHDSLQRLSIDVFDKDQWSKDDYLGKVGDWTAEEAEGFSNKLLHLHDPEEPTTDAGHLQFQVEYLKTLPLELLSETDMCLVVAHFKEVSMPSSEIKGKIAIRCQIGDVNEPRTTKAGKPLGAGLRKIAHKILKDVEKRLQDEGMEDNVIQKVVKLEGLEIENELMKVAINCHLNFLVSFAQMPATEQLKMDLTLIELPDPKAKDKEETILGSTSCSLQELIERPKEDINKDIEITSQVGDGEPRRYTVQVSAQICALQPHKPPPAAIVDHTRDSTVGEIRRKSSVKGQGQNPDKGKEGGQNKAGIAAMRLPVGGWRKKKAASPNKEETTAG